MKASRLDGLRRTELHGGVADTGLPEITAGRYLIEAMWKLRPTRSTGMGEVATGWVEIDAFARATGRISEPWEAETLFEMCAAYELEWRLGENPLRIPPVGRGGD